MRGAFVSCGLEHLGIEALSAWVSQAGHEPILVYEPRPFSSGSGTDEPSPRETAARVIAASYRNIHRWAVDVARAVKRECEAPIVFGGPHVSAVPERAILEPSIDAVVEGEGEGALLDLLECTEKGGLGRTDISNCTFKGDPRPVR